MALWSTKYISLIFALLMALPSYAQTGPSNLNVSGVLFLPSGLPVTQSSVNFRLEVWDKNSTCILYTEDHLAQDLSTSKGGFSLPIGKGSAPTNFLQGGSAFTTKIFENTGAVTGGWADCLSGTTLNSGDERVIRVKYDLGGGLVAMTPDVPIASSAYAMVSDTLQGKTPSDFVQINVDVTQSKVNDLFGPSYPRLQQLLSPTAALGFGNQRLTNLADPSSAQDASTKNYADTKLAGQTIDLVDVAPGFGGGKVLTWDQAQNKWIAMAPSLSGAAGGDLTGAYPNPSVAALAIGTSKLADNAVTSAKINSTGIAPNRLVITDSSSGAGLTYANCANNEVLKFVSGTGWQCATVTSLAPVQSVAGKTGAVTLNAMDIANLGTAALHDVGVGATQVPQLDYLGKLAASTIPAFLGDVTGAVGATVVTALQGRSLASTPPNLNEVLRWNGSRWEPSALTDNGITALTGDVSASGNGTVAATLTNGAVTTPKMFTNPGLNRLVATDGISGAALVPFECYLNEVMHWTANGWACTSPNSMLGSQFIVDGGNARGADLKIGTTDNYALNLITNGANRIYIGTSGRVGIGTTNPGSALDVSGSISSQSGTIRSGQYGQYTTTNTGIYNDAGVGYGITFSTNGSQRAIIDSSGNVGIGTTSPQTNLDVSGSIAVSGGNWVSLDGGGNLTSSSIRRHPAGSRMEFRSGNNIGMVLMDAGNVGIGTTSPNRRLEVSGPIRISPANLPGSPAAGDLAFDSGASNTLKYHDGSNWVSVAGSAAVSGTTGYHAKFTTNSTIGNSAIFESGGNIGLGTTAPAGALDIVGASSSFIRSPSTSLSYPLTIVNNGAAANDRGSAINFRLNSSEMGAVGAAQQSTNNGYLIFSTATSGSLSEKMRIDPTGNVGIGTTTPSAALHVSATGNDGLRITNPGSGVGFHFQADWPVIWQNAYWDGTNARALGAGYVGAYSMEPTNGSVNIWTGNNPGAGNVATIAKRLTILTGGNVGIGTPSPARPLEVAGPIRLGPGTLPATPAAGDLAFDSAAGNSLKFHNGTSWQTVGTSSGTGDFMANGSIPLTGNLRTNGNWLSYGGASAGLFVDSAGRVGIGGSSPARLLHALGPIRIEPSVAPAGAGAGDVFFDSAAANTLKFHNGTSWMTVATGTGSQWTTAGSDINYMTGNVGIGTTNPLAKLSIQNGELHLHNSSAVGQELYVHSDTTWRAPTISYFHSGGTQAAPTAVLNGFQLGYLNFGGYDGSSYVGSANVQINSTENWSTSARGAEMTFGTVANGTTAPTVRLRIAHNGNIGIGVPSPARLLHTAGPIRVAPTVLPLSPAAGDLAFDSGAGNSLKYHNGSNWISVASGTGSQWTTTGANIYYNAGNVGIGTTAPTGILEVSGASTTALAVGPNGATNPTLVVNTNTASAATGLSVTGAAAGGGVALSAVSVGASEGVSLSSKGNAHLTLATGGANGAINLSPNGSPRFQFFTSYATFAPIASTSAASTKLTFSGAADINLVNESPVILFDMGQTRTQSSNTSYATQRDFRIIPTTHAFQTSGGVISNAATLSVDGAANGGTNATLTNSSAISVPSSILTNVTNSYGLNVTAATGAANNYAATFNGGNVGIGTTSPSWALTVSSATPGITLNGVGNAGTFSANYRAYSSRGTASAPSNVLSGDNLGGFVAGGYWTGKANNEFLTGDARGNMSIVATEDWISATNNGTAITFATATNGTGGSAERLRIDHNGNVGIGTSAPTAKLEVNGTIKATNFVGTMSSPSTSNTGSYTINTDTDASGADGGLDIQVRGSSKLAVTDAGLVGIGTTAPSSLLANTSLNLTDSIGGSGLSSSSLGWLSSQTGYVAAFRNANAAGGANGVLIQTASNSTSTFPLNVESNGVPRLLVRGDGNVGIGTTGPNWALEVAKGYDPVISSKNTGAGGTAHFIGFQNNAGSFPTAGMGLAQFQGRSSVAGNVVYPGMAIYATENWSGSAQGTAIAFTTSTNGSTTTNERMRIDQNGNVGIGTTNPAIKLQVMQSTDAAASGLGVTNSAGTRTAYLWTDSSNNARLDSNPSGTSPLLLNGGGGYVGIGTSSPHDPLEVNGSISFTNANQALMFNTYYSGGYKYISSNPAGLIGFDLSGNINFMTATSGTAGNAVSMLQPLTILNGGNVGIGTTNPGTLLDVATSSASNSSYPIVRNTNTNPTIGDGSTTYNYAGLVARAGNGAVRGDLLASYNSAGTPSGVLIRSIDNYPLMLLTNNTERLRIDSSGNVGIGTTGPADKLHVAGDIRVGTGTTGCVKDADGTVIAGTCSSDVRFKTDIEPLGSRLEQVSQLRPVTYKWRSEEFPDKHFGHETETGLIAQEVQRAIPELVAEDEEGYLKVRFTELNIYILQAVKDLYNRVLGVESHQATQDRQIASKADKAETEALRTEVKAKDQEIAKLKADAEKQKQENAEMKARLDKIEKMLKSK